MFVCCLCKLTQLECVLDFGDQPISNRYLQSLDENEFKYPFQLGYCHSCGLVQLIDPPKPADLRPRYDWITYSEPEGHLDNLVDALIKLPNVTNQTSFCAVSHFEISTLDRLKRLNYTNTCQMNIDADLGQRNSLSVIETIQRYLVHGNRKVMGFNQNGPDIIIVRDILEHAHDPLLFMRALRHFVNPNGYVVFEVPDYSKTFSSFDYSTLWEEHITYFTGSTFEKCLKMGGFEIFCLNRYEYDAQDYLVAIVKPIHSMQCRNENKFSTDLTDRQNIMLYKDHFNKTRLAYRSFLHSQRKKGKIALFGAGHLSSHFVNLLGLSDLVNFIIDDHPKKCGMFMPGSQLPILSSSVLQQDDIKLCLLSLSQESEKKVLDSKKWFIDRGGIFSSIFPSSQLALNKIGAEFI